MSWPSTTHFWWLGPRYWLLQRWCGFAERMDAAPPLLINKLLLNVGSIERRAYSVRSQGRFSRLGSRVVAIFEDPT